MKAFKIPVGLTHYSIKFKRKVKMGKSECQGTCDFVSKTIEIGSTESPDVQFTALWHEITHAILHELGSQELTENESFVESVSQNIARIIRTLPPELKQ